MATEESSNATLQALDEKRSSLPVVQKQAEVDVDLKLRMQYFGWTAVPSAIVLEIMGAQLPGIGLAAVAGLATAYFSGELHYAIEPGLRTAGKVFALMSGNSPGSGRVKSRLLSKEWWLGQDMTPYAEEDDRDEGEDNEPTEEEIQAELARMSGTAENTATTFKLFDAPTFNEMCHLIEQGKMVLCYDANGPVFGTVLDLLSMIIIGKPGRGKTTALIYYVAILLKYGAEVHVWDPHGSMSDLAEISDKLHYTDEFEDIPASMKYLFADLQVRRAMYKKDKSTKHPLLLLADELVEMAHYAKKNPEVVELFELFVCSARKWNCFFIGSGQRTDASILPTMISRNLSSRAVFYTELDSARMAGLNNEVAKELLPLLKRDTAKGYMIFDCSRLDPFIGKIPWLTTEDVKRWLGTSSSVYKKPPEVNTETLVNTPVNRPVNMPTSDVKWPSLESRLPFTVNANTEHKETPAPTVNENENGYVSAEVRDYIKRMFDSGVLTHRQISKIVRLDGRKYPIYKAVCLEEGITVEKEA